MSYKIEIIFHLSFKLLLSSLNILNLAVSAVGMICSLCANGQQVFASGQ